MDTSSVRNQHLALDRACTCMWDMRATFSINRWETLEHVHANVREYISSVYTHLLYHQ